MRSTIVSIPAPISGLSLTSQFLAADPGGAAVLDNWIPTQKGIRVRGGLTKVGTLGASVTSLFAYNAATGAKIFAATSSGVFDVSALDNTVSPPQRIWDAANGVWSTQEIATSGGQFLIAVNGGSTGWIYNGTAWNPWTSVAVTDLAYDALTADFAVGETVTGGTSGATATVLAVIRTTATTGTLKLGTVTSGPYQDNEALTSAGGAATANGASASASATTISGVASSALSHVWAYRSRLYFVEKNKLTFWYLPTDSIGGTITSFNLSSVFQRGGSLLFGATWSLDAGDGLDDKCVFVTDQGEVAIYSGNDPSSANTWALEGRYDIGRPLGARAHMQGGGDLLIATREGLMPLSAVIQRQPGTLAAVSATARITPLWQTLAGQTASTAFLLRWPEKEIAILGLPNADYDLVVNLTTGAWATATGWDAACACWFNGSVYFGRGLTVCEAERGGQDDGALFVARYAHVPQQFTRHADHKRAQLLRASFLTPRAIQFGASCGVDYDETFPPAPAAAEGSTATNFLIYDTPGSVYDTAIYAGAIPKAWRAKWRSVNGQGQVLAPMVQVSSGAAQVLDVELTMTELSFERGAPVR